MDQDWGAEIKLNGIELLNWSSDSEKIEMERTERNCNQGMRN